MRGKCVLRVCTREGTSVKEQNRGMQGRGYRTGEKKIESMTLLTPREAQREGPGVGGTSHPNTLWMFDCLLLRQSNDNEGVSDCKAVLFCYK